METFFKQNADLIADDPRFHPFFSEQLRDEPVHPESFSRFAAAVLQKKVPPCGVIVDEQQKLTEAGVRGQEFFKHETGTWTGLFRAFCRWDSASAHGLREFSLPSGENHRLLYLQPPTSDVALQLLNTPGSPYYVKEDVMSPVQKRKLVSEVGAVLRPLAEGVKAFADQLSEDRVHKELFVTQWTTCTDWWNQLSEEEKPEAWPRLLNALRGCEDFAPASKPFYDHGLVKRNPETGCVEPISPIAAAALAKTYCTVAKSHFTSLDSIKNDGERGIHLERQILALVLLGSEATSNIKLVASSLGSQPQLQLSMSGSLRFFNTVEDITPHPTLTTLWVSRAGPSVHRRWGPSAVDGGPG
jgi:hypothetical protein